MHRQQQRTMTMTKKQVNKIIKCIETTRNNTDKSITQISQMLNDLECAMDEKYQSQSEDWRQSNKGAKFEEKIEQVQVLIQQIESVFETFDDELDSISAHLEQ